jgi:hypothetical protein
MKARKIGIDILEFDEFKKHIEASGIQHDFTNNELHEIYWQYICVDIYDVDSPEKALMSCQKMTRSEFLKKMMIQSTVTPFTLWLVEQLVNSEDENLQFDGIQCILNTYPYAKSSKVALIDDCVLVYKGFFDE